MAVCPSGWTHVCFHSWCSWMRAQELSVRCGVGVLHRKWSGRGLCTAEADVLKPIQVPLVTVRQAHRASVVQEAGEARVGQDVGQGDRQRGSQKGSVGATRNGNTGAKKAGMGKKLPGSGLSTGEQGVSR